MSIAGDVFPTTTRAVLLLLGATLASACQPQPDIVLEGDITGRWFGERWEGSARVQWLVDRRDDGHFEVLFHTCFAGDVVRVETHTGVSDFSAGVYRTTIDQIVTDGEIWMAEGDDDAVVYEYEISKLTPKAMHYRSLDYGNRYVVQRVDEDFELECPPARKIVDTNPGGRTGRDAWIRRGVGSDQQGDNEEGSADDTPTDAE